MTAAVSPSAKAWQGASSLNVLSSGYLCRTTAVAKLPRIPHETRRLSDDHEEGIEAVWHRADAIDAKLRNLRKPR